MGRKVSVWLSDEALSILDTVIKERKATNSSRANVSNTLDGLVRTYGMDYIQLLKHIQQAVKRYTTSEFRPPTQAELLEHEQDKAIMTALVKAGEVNGD